MANDLLAEQPSRCRVGGGRCMQDRRSRIPRRVAEPQQADREQGRQRDQADAHDHDGDQDLGQRDPRSTTGTRWRPTTLSMIRVLHGCPAVPLRKAGSRCSSSSRHVGTSNGTVSIGHDLAGPREDRHQPVFALDLAGRANGWGARPCGTGRYGALDCVRSEAAGRSARPARDG